MNTIYKIITLVVLQSLFMAAAICQHTPSIINFQSSEKYCAPLWQDHTFGDCMGRNHSFTPIDYDSDGIDELIVNANASGNPTRYGFWYILKFDPSTSRYEQVYVSRIFEDHILKLAVSTDDNTSRMGVAFEDVLQIYDLSTQSLIQEVEYSQENWSFTNTDMHFRDINNDGIDDILINGRTWFQIIDGSTYNTISELEGDFWRFAIGSAR